MSATAMAEVPNTFLYFAYGSNLLKKRIRINNPSAEFLGIGKLEVSCTPFSVLVHNDLSVLINRKPYHHCLVYQFKNSYITFISLVQIPETVCALDNLF